MKNLLKGRISLLLTFVLGAGILYYALINVGYINRINTLQSELSAEKKKNVQLSLELTNTKADAKKQLDDLQAKLEEAGKKLENMTIIQSSEIEKLKQQGLTDPVKDLKTDLMKRGDLIPYKGTLGGTMNFYGEDDIFILSSKWVVANFEDGHTNGIMLLRYTVRDGKIHWRVMDSFLY